MYQTYNTTYRSLSSTIKQLERNNNEGNVTFMIRVYLNWNEETNNFINIARRCGSKFGSNKSYFKKEKKQKETRNGRPNLTFNIKSRALYETAHTKRHIEFLKRNTD